MTPRGARTRVFVISEHTIHRQGLQYVLNAEAPLRVVGSAKTCGDAMSAVPPSHADVVLLELPSSTLPPAGTLGELTAACAPARILLLTPALETSQVAEALREGVYGVVLENVEPATLIKSLEVVAAGRYWLPSECLAQVVRALPAAEPPRTHDPRGHVAFRLTPRELEIIALVAAGDANKHIALACGISEKTVKHHLTNIFEKVGVSSRLELAVFALEQRIVHTDRHHS